jgi:hypothetical protein
MGKAINLVVIICLILGCKKRNECPPQTVKPIDPTYANWTKPYPIDGIGYVRFKSNRGPEESFQIKRDMDFSKWPLQDEEYCYDSKGEWRNYHLFSTLNRKRFQVSISQYSSTETMIVLVNRSGGMDEGGIIFSFKNPPQFKYYPCDTCLNLFTNYWVNNKLYGKVIRMYCPKGASSYGPENVKEIYMANGYGIIQYTCTDSTVWNLVN